MWGGKGVFTTHATFELGIASIIAPLGFVDTVPTDVEIAQVKSLGLIPYFEQQATEVVKLNMYDNYYQKGWTPKIAKQVRHDLSPIIIKTITVAWYLALQEAAPKGKK